MTGLRTPYQQEKGARLHKRPALIIPVHPALKAELDAWKKMAASTHILTTPKGIPWKATHLTSEMARLLPDTGLPAGLSVNGLRKLGHVAC